MSLIDTIKHAGSNTLHFGGNIIHKAEDAGSEAVKKVKHAGSNSLHGFEKVGSIALRGAISAEHAAVKSLQFQGNLVKAGLQKEFDVARNLSSKAIKFEGAVLRKEFNVARDLSSKAVHFEGALLRKEFEVARNLSSKAINFAAGLFDKISHPGDPNPKAAQGLQFSETKGASSLAYEANKGDVYQFPDGKNWKVIDVKDDQRTGFRAIALKPTDPNDHRVIVSFAGTRDLKDWKANVGQGLGLPTKQYEQAVDFAKQWKASDGNNVILTGHSLGGGLASYASIKTGLNATAVNSAPLALEHLGLNPRSGRHITQYYVPGEALTEFTKAVSPANVRPGNQIAVRGKGSIFDPRSIGNNHSIDSVAPGVPEPRKTN